jgi:hypothetical protein
VTFGGQVAAVEKMCAAIPPDSSVLLTETVGHGFAQVIRGDCGLPTAIVLDPTPKKVIRLAAAIRRAGRRPVMLGGSGGYLAGYGGETPVHVLSLRMNGDPHTFVTAPRQPLPMNFDVWMSEFPK